MPVDDTTQLWCAVDEAEVARVEVAEEAVTPELLHQRLVLAQRSELRMIDSYVTTKFPSCIVPSIADLMHCSK